MSKITILEILEAKKQGRQFPEVCTSDLNEAVACAEAGVEIEIVRAAVTAEIAKRLDIALISMGSSSEGGRPIPLRHRRPGHQYWSHPPPRQTLLQHWRRRSPRPAPPHRRLPGPCRRRPQRCLPGAKRSLRIEDDELATFIASLE